MMGFLQNLWIGKVSTNINKQRKAIGLEPNVTSGRTATFPKLVAVGAESHGKTSVICRMLAQDILPKGEDIITRRPIILECRYIDESLSTSMVLTLPSLSSSLTSRNPKEILKAIDDDFALIRNSGEGVSNIEGKLILYSSNVVNVDIIELPGVMLVSQSDEPNTLPSIVRDMVSKYICDEKCIILAIFDANGKERQSPIIELLKKSRAKIINIKTI